METLKFSDLNKLDMEEVKKSKERKLLKFIIRKGFFFTLGVLSYIVFIG